MKNLGLITIALAFCLAGVANAATNSSQSKSEEFKPSYGLSYFNYMNGPKFEGGEGMSVNHFIIGKRTLTDQSYVGLVLRPNTNIGTGADVFTLGDSYARYSRTITKKTARVSVTWQPRYYAPLSEASQDANLIGKFDSRFYVSYSLGKVDMLHLIIPRYYLSTDAADTDSLILMDHVLITSYNVSPKVTVDVALETLYMINQVGGVSGNDATTDIGFTYKFTKNFALSPYVEFNLADPTLNSTYAAASVDWKFF